MVGVTLLCSLSVNAQKILNGSIDGCSWKFTTHDGLLVIDSGKYSENLDYSHDKWKNIIDYIYQGLDQTKRFQNFEVKKIEIKGNIKIIDCDSLFCNLSNVITIDLRGLKTDNVKNMAWMFNSCPKLEEIIMPNISTKNVTNMSKMFLGCNKLKFVDFSKFDISNVITMESMFRGCSSMDSISLPKTYSGKCTDLSYMFQSCENLQNISLEKFSLRNVQNLSYMFDGCKKLKTIDASNISANNAEAQYMFRDCYMAKTIKFPKFNGPYINVKGIADNCNSLEIISMAKSKISVSTLINAIKGIYSATRIHTIDLTDCVQNEVVASPFNNFPNISTIISNTNSPNNLPNGFFDALRNKKTVKVVIPDYGYFEHTQTNGWKEICPPRGMVLTDEDCEFIPGKYTRYDLRYTREASDDYETFCLPFQVGLTSNDDFIFYTFSGYGEIKNGKCTLRVSPVTTPVSAGTPFIAKSRKGAKFTFKNNVTGCELTNNQNQKKVSLFLMIINKDNHDELMPATIKGTYSTIPSDPNFNYFSIKAPNNLVATNEVLPFRAYIETKYDYSNKAKIQSFDISFDNDVETTGIIDIEENKAKEDVFYNLGGQRVSNNTNGLIIKNGKKYFVK